MYKKEKKTRKVGVVVGLIKKFRQSLLGEERKESEKRKMTQRVTRGVYSRAIANPPTRVGHVRVNPKKGNYEGRNTFSNFSNFSTVLGSCFVFFVKPNWGWMPEPANPGWSRPGEPQKGKLRGEKHLF